MRRRMLCCAMIVAASAASAQVPGLGALAGGKSGLGGALGALGGTGLPNLSSMGASNATGVLSYCVKRKLLATTGTQSVLGKLTGQPGVTGSSGFAAGANGQIVTPSGQFSLDGLKDGIKGRVCSLVLDHAQSFIGR